MSYQPAQSDARDRILRNQMSATVSRAGRRCQHEGRVGCLDWTECLGFARAYFGPIESRIPRGEVMGESVGIDSILGGPNDAEGIFCGYPRASHRTG